MSGGFQVVLADIASAAKTFDRESTTFERIMPPDGPSVPSGGDDAFDKMLRSTVLDFGLLHLQLAGVIEDHANKLRSAHGTYQRREEDMTRLCRDLTNDASL